MVMRKEGQIRVQGEGPVDLFEIWLTAQTFNLNTLEALWQGEASEEQEKNLTLWLILNIKMENN